MNRKLKREILEKIQKNEIKMRPKWWFVAKALSLRGFWWLMILAVSISMSVIVYFWQIYNPAELIEFGEIGIDLIASDFPYLWLTASVVFFTGGAVLLSKLGNNYKKTTKIILAVTAITVIVATIMMVIARNLLEI